MKKPSGHVLTFSLLVLSLLAFLSQGAAQQKLRFGTSYTEAPIYYLPVLAGQEQGFWQRRGLDVQYLPFRGGSVLYQALVAGEVDAAVSSTASQIHGISVGVPMLIIAELSPKTDFALWVLPGSPVKDVQTLQGQKIGTGKVGSMAHIYGRIVTKAVGIDKEAKHVSLEAFAERLAALRTGSVVAMVEATMAMAELWHKGEVRLLGQVSDYLPKKWLEHSMVVHKELAQKKPEAVKGTVKGYVEAVAFVKANPAWAVEKMKFVSGFSGPVAQSVYEKFLTFTNDGSFDKETVAGVRNLLIDYGVVAKEKAPALEQIYTSRFLERR